MGSSVRAVEGSGRVKEHVTDMLGHVSI